MLEAFGVVVEDEDALGVDEDCVALVLGAVVVELLVLLGIVLLVAEVLLVSVELGVVL